MIYINKETYDVVEACQWDGQNHLDVMLTAHVSITSGDPSIPARIEDDDHCEMLVLGEFITREHGKLNIMKQGDFLDTYQLTTECLRKQ